MAPHRMATPESNDGDVIQTYPTTISRPLLPGIYSPTPCFFLANEELDLATISHHAVSLARAGLAGIATQGSNGEAVHLTPAERVLVTQTTRTALDAAGFSHLPIIVGCGAQSTRETIALCKDAAIARGDYVLILPPSYFNFGLRYPLESLITFFHDVADASPLPVLIYNFPSAAAGIDLSSDTLLHLAKHPNIIGTKLTDGNLGRMNRVIAGTTTIALQQQQQQQQQHQHPYMTLAGSADFLLPSLHLGAGGGLVGLANILPKTCVALQHAWEAGNAKQARYLAGVLSRADEIVQKGGIVGTKAVMQEKMNYGGFARRPLPRLGEGVTEHDLRAWLDGIQEGWSVEQSL